MLKKKVTFITFETKKDLHTYHLKQFILKKYKLDLIILKNSNRNISIKLINEFFFLIKSFFKCLFLIKKTNILIIQIPLLSNFFLFFLLKKFKFFEYSICYVSDFWPYTFKNYFKSNLFYNLICKFTNTIYSKFDSFLVLNDFTKKKLKLITKKKKIIQILPGIYKSKISNTNTIEKNNNKHFLYYGNIGLFQPLEFIIKAFIKLNNHNKNIYLHIVGTGVLKKKIVNLYNIKKYNIKFVDFISNKGLLNNNIYNAHIVSVKKNLFGNIPSKISFSLYANILNLIFADGELVQKLKKCALIGRPENLNDAVKLFEFIIDPKNKKTINNIKKNAKDYYLRNYSISFLNKNFKKLLS